MVTRRWLQRDQTHPVPYLTLAESNGTIAGWENPLWTSLDRDRTSRAGESSHVTYESSQ
jgi:hypothetical protein